MQDWLEEQQRGRLDTKGRGEERWEEERLEQERLKQERLEQERLEQERLEQERLEQERLEQERLERVRKRRTEIDMERVAAAVRQAQERQQVQTDAGQGITSTNLQSGKN
jgi:hypothetical protein